MFMWEKAELTQCLHDEKPSGSIEYIEGKEKDAEENSKKSHRHHEARHQQIEKVQLNYHERYK